MGWKQFAWLIAALIPGSLPGFMGAFVLIGFPHINLPPITGWLLIIQSLLFIYLCAGKFLTPPARKSDG